MQLRSFIILLTMFIVTSQLEAQSFTRQDTLRGSITPERAWWDLTYYDLDIEVDPATKSIKGSNTIYFNVLSAHQIMQVDLQDPLRITDVQFRGKSIPFKKEGYAYWLTFPSPMIARTSEKVTVYYEGTPIEAQRPPWDGGFTWSKDQMNQPFVATSCQGLGASAWWPCKDHMYDEPDSMLIRVTAPPQLMDVSNGRLRHIDYHNDGRRTWHWFVSNPVNNYGINANIAKYLHWSDTLHGEKGVLDLDFYVLAEHYDTALVHFEDVYKTIRAFEYWFGPYPFYEDGFKLVEVPYLGMEHQSSVTYGNKYLKGYLGRDLSQTGWGMKWDFIIVHESAHEWWANSITYKDIADMWIHESFAHYAEALFLDYHFGTQAGNEYVIGTRLNILNDIPVIGHYNVNNRGSGDMYFKGASMLHNIRTWMNDDVLFRKMLRDMQKDFYHKTVTTEEIESYMSRVSGKNLDPVFDQYLRDVRIPVFSYQRKGKKLLYRYTDTVQGFNMPVRISINGGEMQWVYPTSEWQSIRMKNEVIKVEADPNFYVHSIDNSLRK